MSPRSASSATAALKLSEKFRRFVILVSIRSGWTHLSTLSEFAGPLQGTSTVLKGLNRQNLKDSDLKKPYNIARLIYSILTFKSVNLFELVPSLKPRLVPKVKLTETYEVSSGAEFLSPVRAIL